MAVHEGAKYLEEPMQGRGILLAGVPGVYPAEVTIIGAGVVGSNACKMAAGLWGSPSRIGLAAADNRQARAGCQGPGLISPEPNFKGLHMADAINDAAVRTQISILLIAGQQKSRAKEECKRLYDSFKKYHTDPDKKDLFQFLPKTPLQGTKLLSEPSLNVNKAIGEFIGTIEKQQIPWAERATPLN